MPFTRSANVKKEDLMRKLICLTISALVLTAYLSAAAVDAKGGIAGRVVDASGLILQGAQVQLEGTDLSVRSDVQGEFSFTDLAPGVYKIHVSYLGFKTFDQDVTVVGGGVQHLDVQMEVASDNDHILVTAERPRAEAGEINRERSADNVLEVLSAEVITSLPNANVADALGRLPSVTLERDEGEGEYIQVRSMEPRLANVTIDGLSVPSPEPTVRQIRLDVVPADLVESVEVNETLAPNMDGDGIAGSVNMKTKTAGEFPTLTLYGLGGYNQILGGRYNDQFGGTFGHRFGKKKKFGFLFGGTYDFNGRGIDNFQPAIDPNSTFSQPIYDNNTIREYRYYRNRWGYAGSADYNLSDFSHLYLRGLYSNLQDYGDKWYYEPQATSNPKFYTSSKRPDVSISSIALGGKHQLDAASLFSWEVSFARSYELDSAGNPKADFSWIGPKLVCGYNPAIQANPLVPHFGNGCDDSANSPLLAASNWGFKDITTSTGLSAQVNLTGSVSYARSYRLGSHFGILEIGAKVRNGHKFQNATETVYDGWTPANYPMTMFLDPFTSTNYIGGYYFGGHYGQVSSFNALQSFTLSHLSSYVDGYNTASDTYPNIFDIVERISAGYIMDTMDFGRLHVVAGVRFEGTQMNTLGYNVTLFPAGATNCSNPTGCGLPVPVYNSPSYIDVLPSISMKYPLDSNSAIRAVYARGVSRPDSYQLVPYVVEDDSTNPPTIAEGNPQLKPEHANNYDLLYERYLNPTGIVRAGFFFKQIDDTLISTSYTATSGQYAGDLISQFLNVGNAEIHGFEVSYQQRLSMLPGPLKGLGVMANYTWTGSRISNIPGRSDSPALQRQAPTSWNISPTYDRGRVSMRVGMSYNGASIYQYQYQSSDDPNHLGPTGPTGDVYTLAHFQLDAQASVRLGHGLSAVVYGLNMTNEVFGYYTGSPIFVNQREWYKPTYAGGLRYNLNRER
jgi:TonB-dependent receptor